MKLKFSLRKYFRKRFWYSFEAKNECSEPLMMKSISFLQILECRSRNRFLEKWCRALKTIWLGNYLGIGSILENGFEATSRTKINIFCRLKWHFSLFCKHLSNEIKTICWESETTRYKLFKSKFGHMKLFRK